MFVINPVKLFSRLKQVSFIGCLWPFPKLQGRSSTKDDFDVKDHGSQAYKYECDKGAYQFQSDDRDMLLSP